MVKLGFVGEREREKMEKHFQFTFLIPNHFSEMSLVINLIIQS